MSRRVHREGLEVAIRLWEHDWGGLRDLERDELVEELWHQITGETRQKCLPCRRNYTRYRRLLERRRKQGENLVG